MKYSFVFGFRNREVIRVKRCLDSLARQQFKDFEVVFTDFGSDSPLSSEVKELCATYSFVRYYYNEVKGMPWNRSYALNTGVRLAQGEYIIFGDVDLIYSVNFLDTVEQAVRPDISLYGEYLTLPEEFSDWSTIHLLDASKLVSFGKTAKGGLHIVLKSKLVEIGVYDEYYCYWGVEDRDLNWRLTQIGLQEVWIPGQAPVFHQWHPVTSDFYKSGFPLQWWEDMNIHFESNRMNLVRNNGGWGKLLTREDRPVLNNEFKSEVVRLECADSIFSANGKSQTIATIYKHLHELKPNSRVRFEFIRSKNDFPNNIAVSTYFSRVLIHQSDWERVKKQIHKLSSRLNHFIPDEDLQFIFHEIIHQDKRFDYSFSKNEDCLTWEFALKSTVI